MVRERLRDDLAVDVPRLLAELIKAHAREGQSAQGIGIVRPVEAEAMSSWIPDGQLSLVDFEARNRPRVELQHLPGYAFGLFVGRHDVAVAPAGWRQHQLLKLVGR